MKRVYERPAVYVEAVQLDKPIAMGCTASAGDMSSLLGLGWFSADRQCSIPISSEDDGTLPGYDTICYHSNVQTAFTS